MLMYNEEEPKNISAHVQCACMNTCLCAQARVYMYMNERKYEHACMCACVHACAHVCACKT